MTDYSELVNDLREYLTTRQISDLLEAQAKEIAELEAMRKRDMDCIKRASIRIAELEAALKPFVKVLEWNCEETAPDDWYLDNEGTLTVGILRAARAALKGEKG